MKELFMSLDYQEVIIAIWTFVILPILTYVGTEIQKWAKSKKIDKYTTLLEKHIKNAVKDMQETVVKDIKGTEKWTEEIQIQIKESAKTIALNALGNAGRECIKSAVDDFDAYIDSLVGTALFNIKNQGQNE